jgi:hypothetical protein
VYNFIKKKFLIKRNLFCFVRIENKMHLNSPYISRITLPNQPKPQKETKRFIVLPFVNKKAEDFAVRLKSLVEESYSQVDFNVAFKSPKTIGSLFPFKDQIKEKTSQSLVFYVKINRKTCNVDYIGKTERILVHRLKEHQKKKQTTNKSA